jgi:hypothetical protein
MRPADHDVLDAAGARQGRQIESAGTWLSASYLPGLRTTTRNEEEPETVRPVPEAFIQCLLSCATDVFTSSEEGGRMALHKARQIGSLQA